MELWNKGIYQNSQQLLKPQYLKKLQDQVRLISQFSKKRLKGKRLFSYDVQSNRIIESWNDLGWKGPLEVI